MMNKAIKIPTNESQNVEFKLSFQEKLIETLVAFANTEGGTVYVGINDKAEVIGIELGKETIPKWLNNIKIRTQPSIIPTITEHRFQNKTFVTVQVQEFPIKPVSYKGRYYKRVSNSNHLMTALEISNLNLQTLQISWDSYKAPSIKVDDLDFDKVTKFINRVNSKGRFQLPENPIESLTKLKLIKDQKVSNAAFLMFSKEENKYNIHVGRFKTPSLIVDDRILRLTLFEAVEETMKYIISHIKYAYEITGQTTQRKEIPEYPLDALRELVLNAIIHRDYLSSADVQIKIFDNYITFYNPGKLPQDLTIEDLKTDSYPAYARNKLIAEAFYLTGDIEKYGSGFLRIRKSIKNYPSMSLDIKEIAGGLMVTLSYNQQKTHSSEGLSEGLNEGLNEGLKSLYKAVASNPGIQAKDLPEVLKDRSLKTVERQVAQLITMKLVERKGSRKTGGYYITSSNTEII